MKKSGLTKIVFGTILAGPAVALGAVHPSVLAFFLALTTLFFAYTKVFRGGSREMRIDLPSVVFLSLIVAASLQLVPLPAGLVKMLSPAAHEIHLGSLSPLGGPEPSFMPLTLDPTLTLMDLGKLTLLFMVYLICTFWTRRYGSTFIIQAVIATGIIAVAIFLGHRIAFAQSVYGIYLPKHTHLRGELMFAPLLNPNHLAALLGMATAIGIGYTQEIRTRTNRILLIIITSLMGGSLFLTLSRGGIAAFFVGQATFVLFRLLVRSKSNALKSSPAQLVGIFITLAGIGLFATQDALVAEYASGDLEKLQILRESIPLIAKYPLFGIGKGAFGVGFVQVSDYGPTRIFTHPENALLQLLADYGVILGTFVLIAGFIVFYRILRMNPTRPRNGAAIAALTAFGLHNLVDFNMEVSGVAIVAVAVLATQTCRKSYRFTQKSLWPKVLLSGTILVGSLLALAIGLYLPSRYLDNEQRRLHQAVKEQNISAFEVDAMESALSRHPADWYTPFVAGVFHYHNNTDDPVPWLDRALTLHPTAAPARFYMGRQFLKKKQLSRALDEFRLAIDANPRLLKPTSEELVQALPVFEILKPLAMSGAQKALFWPALADALAQKGHAIEANKADEQVLQIVAGHPSSLNRRAKRLARAKQFDEAKALATRLQDLEDHQLKGTLLLTEIAVIERDFDRGIRLLEENLKTEPRDMNLWRQIALVHVYAGHKDQAVEAATHLVSVAPNEKSRANALIIKANVHERLGQSEEALSHYRKASAILPRSIRVLVKIAVLAERTGNFARAIEALTRLQAEEPDNNEWNERLQQVKLKQSSPSIN